MKYEPIVFENLSTTVFESKINRETFLDSRIHDKNFDNTIRIEEQYGLFISMKTVLSEKSKVCCPKKVKNYFRFMIFWYSLDF